MTQKEKEEIRLKEFTALLYTATIEDILKKIKEDVEKWLTPIVNCKEVHVSLEEKGCIILLIFEDTNIKISLFELTILEAQNLTKEYLVLKYGKSII